MKIFDLELSSPCNAKCDFCPQNWHGVKREHAFLDVDILDKITAEIGLLARQESTYAVLCGMGENLLNKSLVIRALDNLQQASDGHIFTLLVSNGSKLTPDLLDHESFRKLTAIQISVTGYDKATYEKLYGLKHDQVVENITAMARALPGKVYIRTIDLERLRTGSAKDDFIRFWRDRGVDVNFRPLHSRGGHIVDPEAYPGRIRQFAGCEIYNYITFVSSDGKVLSCCHDVLSDNVIGDCRESTLTEIMQRKQDVQASAFLGYAICAKCTDFELSSMRL